MAAAGVYLSAAELQALHGCGPLAISAYVWLRSWMDYDTGEVGRPPHVISLGKLRAYCERHIPRGAGFQVETPTEKDVRMALDQLERAGLCIRISESRILVFRLPQAGVAEVRQKQTGHVAGTLRAEERARCGHVDVVDCEEEKQSSADEPGTVWCLHTGHTSKGQRVKEKHHEPSAVLRPPACARTHAREDGAAPGEAIADLPTDVAPSKPDAVPAQEEPRPDAAPAEVDPDAVPGRGTADADSAPDADSGNSRSDPQAYRLALIASGFAEGQTVKPAALRLLRQWSADAVPLPLIADAAAVATGRLGSLPGSPAYLAPIVAELSRSAGDPHVRSDRRPAPRVAGGGRPCLADQAADAERRALDALQLRRRPERDITPDATDAS